MFAIRACVHARQSYSCVSRAALQLRRLNSPFFVGLHDISPACLRVTDGFATMMHPIIILYSVYYYIKITCRRDTCIMLHATSSYIFLFSFCRILPRCIEICCAAVVRLTSYPHREMFSSKTDLSALLTGRVDFQTHQSSDEFTVGSLSFSALSVIDPQTMFKRRAAFVVC